ncbi:MAG: histidine kinase, partial [Bacteroidia bacterium]|nr:histidine kinase [Bacteroidia bacterium]
LSLSAHLQYAAGCLSALVFTSSIKVLLYYFREKKKNDEVEKQRLDTELKYLKNQINPHFFFNTLNSLYGLALDKSESTPDAILQLSSIMDYVLHGSNRKEVPVNDEIAILENYIALEKLRYDRRVNITFEKEGDLSNYSIAPLLLLPLLENAFKHGAQLQESGTTDIIITIRMQNKCFYFSIKNTIPINVNRKLAQSGIGLENLKRRLDLLYSNFYEFSSNRDNDVFFTSLILKQN